MDEGNRCTADGCDKPIRSSRSPWCEMHYYRLRRKGTLTARTWHRRGICAVDGCDQAEKLRGYCSRHETRYRRHGDPLVVRQPRVHSGAANGWWSGDAVTYSGAHDRVRHARGAASGHLCADCGGQASQWSYDHADANEKPSTEGPYSADVEHYEPRCVPCHKAFDLHYLSA